MVFYSHSSSPLQGYLPRYRGQAYGIVSPGSSSSSANTATIWRLLPVGLTEHRGLFHSGFQPSKIYNGGKGKGRGKGNLPPPKKIKQMLYWKKNSICLANCRQSLKPAPRERMQFVKIGLTSRIITFELEGTAWHVHDTITKEYPVLEECGGYTLLCLVENSHNLVEIEEPLDGLITIQYLKDILNNAVLYICPLQCSISQEKMQPLTSNQV